MLLPIYHAWKLSYCAVFQLSPLLLLQSTWVFIFVLGVFFPISFIVRLGLSVGGRAHLGDSAWKKSFWWSRFGTRTLTLSLYLSLFLTLSLPLSLTPVLSLPLSLFFRIRRIINSTNIFGKLFLGLNSFFTALSGRK